MLWKKTKGSWKSGFIAISLMMVFRVLRCSDAPPAETLVECGNRIPKDEFESIIMAYFNIDSKTEKDDAMFLKKKYILLTMVLMFGAFICGYRKEEGGVKRSSYRICRRNYFKGKYKECRGGKRIFRKGL